MVHSQSVKSREEDIELIWILYKLFDTCSDLFQNFINSNSESSISLITVKSSTTQKQTTEFLLTQSVKPGNVPATCRYSSVALMKKETS